jgi:hypothetical protein
LARWDRAMSPRVDGECGEEIRARTRRLAAHVARITMPVGPTADGVGRRGTEAGAATQRARDALGAWLEREGACPSALVRKTIWSRHV